MLVALDTQPVIATVTRSEAKSLKLIRKYRGMTLEGFVTDPNANTGSLHDAQIHASLKRSQRQSHFDMDSRRALHDVCQSYWHNCEANGSI